jgi:DNA mismatch repair ATPase MutL
MLNTSRVDSAAEVFHGVFGSKLGDSVREVQYGSREERIKISGFLSLSLHHFRDLQFISVNKQGISSCELHKEVQDMFRRVKTFPAFLLIRIKTVGLTSWNLTEAFRRSLWT